MSTGSSRKPRQFPTHRDRVEAGLQCICNGTAQRTHLPDARRRLGVDELSHAKPPRQQRPAVLWRSLIHNFRVVTCTKKM